MKRDLWVDYTKNIACVLVVCGHFYQSMVASQIVPETTFYRWFIQTIYYFHVPLFFICSGYLFQKYSRDGWARRTFSKVLSLGVPYVVFTFISLLLKKAAGDGINRPEGGILETFIGYADGTLLVFICSDCDFHHDAIAEIETSNLGAAAGVSACETPGSDA